MRENFGLIFKNIFFRSSKKLNNILLFIDYIKFNT